jgi:hypothetical protein
VLVTLAVGGVAGLAAALVMDLPMSRQSEGFTPAYIAASVLRRSPPSDVSFRDANLVHHAAGGTIYEERATAVRGQWLRSSLVFGAALAVIAPALFSTVV